MYYIVAGYSPYFSSSKIYSHNLFLLIRKFHDEKFGQFSERLKVCKVDMVSKIAEYVSRSERAEK